MKKNANAACRGDKLQRRQIMEQPNRLFGLVDEMLREREKVVMQSVGESELSSISNDTNNRVAQKRPTLND
jgi:stage V sporulation protein SpoVS